MEDESKIIMSLKAYTDLIRENDDIKHRMARYMNTCERLFRNRISSNNICNYELNGLDKKNCEEWLKKDELALINHFTFGLNSLYSEYDCFSNAEARAITIDIIKSKISDRLEELNEDDE